MEGKEVRFGVGESVLTAVVTSNTSTGSYNSMFDSWQPLGLLAPLTFMLLGGKLFSGGLGAGVYSIVMIALVGVFLGGLMVGRTPAYTREENRVGRNAVDCVVCAADAHGRAAAERRGAGDERGPGGADDQHGTARLY